MYAERGQLILSRQRQTGARSYAMKTRCPEKRYTLKTLVASMQQQIEHLSRVSKKRNHQLAFIRSVNGQVTWH